MSESDKPNIVYIMTDQHRFEFLGCHGHPLVKTPNIDKLAAAGVDFQRAYSQSAICMPSRVTNFTGQYLHTHGVQSNWDKVEVSGLTMLPDYLRQNGYQTAAVGKTHCGASKDVGFDDYRLCAGLNEGETNDYDAYLVEKGIRHPEEDGKVRWHHGDDMKEYSAFTSDIPYEHSVEAWTGDQCLDYLDEIDRGRPFFLWATFERPHAPTCVPSDNPFPYDPNDVELPEFDERWYTKPDVNRPGCENMWNVFNTGADKLRLAIANYCSLISMIDDQVGRIVAKLEEMGQLENTIIVFTADHGDFAGEYGQFGKNLTTFDVLYRVPFIWYWKNVTAKERIYEMVEQVDAMPTLLDLIGVKCPRTVQGESFAAAVRGSALQCGHPWDGKEEVFFETPYVKTVRTKTHKLSLCKKGHKSWGQLYNLVEDPMEWNNLYDHPEHDWIQRELERRLFDWFVETQQPQCFGGGVGNTCPQEWRWYRLPANQ